MFNVKEFLESDYRTDYVEEKIGNETFLIRRLNGFERLQFIDIKTYAERVLFTIANGLLDGRTKLPIGEKHAKLFVERFDVISETLATRILNLTNAASETEKAEIEHAEKNLHEMSGNGDTVNTADATV